MYVCMVFNIIILLNNILKVKISNYVFVFIK